MLGRFGAIPRAPKDALQERAGRPGQLRSGLQRVPATGRWDSKAGNMGFLL